MRGGIGLAWLGPFLIAGCSFTQPPAPVREVAEKTRPLQPVVKPLARIVPTDMSGYVVQPGDSLYKIAFEQGLDYRRLADWNGLADPSRIRAGDSLRLSPPEAARTEPAGLIADPARRPATVAPRVVADDIPETAPATWVWPARGSVAAGFDEAAGRKGVDIGGSRGTPVLAAAAGRVVYAGAGLRGYGKLIIIKHSRVLLSAYGHNDRMLVTEGQAVKLGQTIGEMGDTDADRIKLHFEIREYGKPVNPLSYLPAMPG